MRLRLLEVERKFCSTGPSALFTNIGPPPFRRLNYHGSRIIHDKYFDFGHLLRLKGIYVRQRNSSWEAKVKKGGSSINSQFEEVNSESEIASFVHDIAGLTENLSVRNDFGLYVVAEIRTKRLSWTADDKFKIVLDTTDFGHEVGEVALEKWTDTEDRSEEDVKGRAEMDKEIAAFMEQYSWAFPRGNPKGKLSAYFEMAENVFKSARCTGMTGMQPCVLGKAR